MSGTNDKQSIDIAVLQNQMQTIFKLIEEGFKRNDQTMAEIKANQKEHEANDIARHEAALAEDKKIIQGLAEYKVYVSSTFVKKERLKIVGGTVSVLRGLLMAILVDRPKMFGGK